MEVSITVGLAERDCVREKWKRSDSYDDPGGRPPGNDNIQWKGILVLVAVIFAVVYSCGDHLLLPGIRKTATPEIPQLQAFTDAFLSQQPLPENGSCKIFYPPESCVATFTVKTDLNNHYLVKLVDSSNNPALYLFVRANSIASIKAPLGTYELRWVYGSKWYGYENLFGSSSTYEQALHPLVFCEEPTATGRTITGRKITFKTFNGNLPSTRIGSGQF